MPSIRITKCADLRGSAVLSYRRFAVGETLKGEGLIDERFNQRSVGLMFFGVRKRVLNLLMVDEVIGLTRFGIVHGDLSATSAVS